MPFNAVPLIRAKREKQTLAATGVRDLVRAYTGGDVPDYQMSAFLMAALLNGLDTTETAALTEAMLHSGIVVNLSDVAGRKVDKHSTGGVGDKVSLLLAPLVAACGVPVPMISGRGLGHTGGTLDKLESIPGFRTNLSLDAYRTHLEKHGVVMIGQTDEIAPADKKIYALRDVTATVEFIPFIAASIMSKKLAAGLDALVLDVKMGRGAFMQQEADARRLAETLVGIGLAAGVPTIALLTGMDVPLGRAVGNWPEVVETVRCLRGNTTGAEDLMEVTLGLAGEMLALGGVAATPEAGRAQAQTALTDGRAWRKWVELVEAQGGSTEAFEDPEAREGYTPARVLRAEQDGYLSDLDALAVGQLSVEMGAGRRTKEDAVDPLAGIVLHAKPGEAVSNGQPLASLYTQRTSRLDEFEAAFRTACTFSTTPPPPPKSLVRDRYDGSKWRNA